MNLRKKGLVVTSAILGSVLLVLLVLPLLFKDRIAARIEAAVDRAVEADVSWGGVELSFLRTFPAVTLGLRDLSVVGVAPFAGDTLAAVDRLRVSLDLGSVLRSVRGRGPLVVRSVLLESPAIGLRVLEDGSASWDLITPKEAADGGRSEAGGGATEAGRTMAVQLRRLEVVDGRIAFDNAPSGLTISMDGVQHALSGDFSQSRVVAEAHLHADRTTLVFAGIPYLPGVSLDFDSEVDVDVDERRVTLQDNELRLNELLLQFSGAVAREDEDLVLDVTFGAPDTDFRQVLSLLPAIYAEDFASLETSGRFSVSGSVRGGYGPEAFPAFDVRASVDDGSFRYPDLPLPARGITARLAVTNPGGDADSTVVDLAEFHLEIGGQPIDAAVTVRTPVSDPDVDGSVRGTLDLEALSRTVKLSEVEALTGTVTADARARARMSDLDEARYDRMAADGTVAARDVVVRAPALRQPIGVEEMALSLSPARADLRTFRASLGTSDFDANGRIENLLGFVMRGEPLRGDGTFHSDRFVLDEWKSGEALEAIPVPSMLDLILTGTVDELTYGTLRMTDARGRVEVRDRRLILDDFGFNTLGGRIAMTGHYETTDVTRPTFGLDLDIDSVDVAGAAGAFVAVRTLAPVARYAQGTFSSDLSLSGALTPDLAPVLDVLDGTGSLLTSSIAIQGFPMLERLARFVPVPEIDHPVVSAVRSSIRIEDGRLHVAPFDVTLAGLTMTVDGSNGIDQSLDYRLSLAVPRALLGGAADRVVEDLASRAGAAGLDVAPGETVRVGVRVAGSVTEPALDARLGDPAASARAAVESAAEAAVGREVDEARERVDSVAAEARRRAQAQADSIVAEADRRAEQIREEGRRLAEQVRAEGERGAQEVLQQATNPIARAAAQPVADRIRREAEERAAQIEREADARADALEAEARARAADVLSGAGGGG